MVAMVMFVKFFLENGICSRLGKDQELENKHLLSFAVKYIQIKRHSAGLSGLPQKHVFLTLKLLQLLSQAYCKQIHTVFS